MAQTAVELLHQQSNELITQYIDGKIDKRELLTMHHNLLYPHKQMEKEQHNETWLTAQEESLHEKYLGRSRLFLEYFKETYERK